MQITGKAIMHGMPEQVWQVIMDPEVLAQSLPGCEKLEEIGPDQYIAHVKLGVAAIKGRYEGKVKLSDKQPNNHYRIDVEGQGGPGWVKAAMLVDLAPENGKTAITYTVDAEVGGLIASVGSRLLSGVAKMQMGDMFKQLNKQLIARTQKA